MADHIDRLNAAVKDRYAIERELGRGGMATVFLAQDPIRNHPRFTALYAKAGTR